MNRIELLKRICEYMGGYVDKYYPEIENKQSGYVVTFPRDKNIKWPNGCNFHSIDSCKYDTDWNWYQQFEEKLIGDHKLIAIQREETSTILTLANGTFTTKRIKIKSNSLNELVEALVENCLK